jgi:hypothetical protein
LVAAKLPLGYDRWWPNPGTREGQLYGSSLAALTYAGVAALESHCGRAAEVQTRLLLFTTCRVKGR